MGIFSSIGKAVKSVGKAVSKGVGSTVKAVGKVAGGALKVGGALASSVISKVPVVGQVYDTATALVGVDPVKLLANSVSSVVSGGNIVNDFKAGIQDSITGGIVGMLTAKGKDEVLPEYSDEEPGVYCYDDGSYAYTVLEGGKVVYDPTGTLTQQTAVQAPNGALEPIPSGLASKQMYIKQLLDSYGNPLGTDKAAYTMSAVNNFTKTGGQLDGAEASNILALDVVNQSPEALAYTASALSQTAGGSSVDWTSILLGIWNTAKDANIPGVSDALKKVEDQVYGVSKQAVTNTGKKKFSDWLYDNWLLVAGGALALALVVVLAKRK